jgi:penicillin amidase
VAAVFKPWWTSAGVPVGEDHAGLALSSLPTSLTEDLDAWTEGDPGNPAFSLPSGERRTAADVMREAFGAAVTHLAAKLGGAPSSWTWGRLHSREFTSLTGAAGLSYGPRPAGGDGWTVDAAYGEPTSKAGPSWRMIVQLGSATAAVPVSAEGVYPGGQSENPASPWYADQIADWWNGRYLPMPPATGYATGPIRWDLRP